MIGTDRWVLGKSFSLNLAVGRKVIGSNMGNPNREKYRSSGLSKSPSVRLLSSAEANIMLEKWHYLGPVRGIIEAWGHEEGCLVFTNCRSRNLEKRLIKQGRVIELARMVGMPGHVWAMSSLMSLCMKEVLKRYDICITYADPRAGHNGAVYAANNWIFDGEIKKDGHPVILIDAKIIAPRTLYDKHGTQSIPKLQEIYGNRLVTESKPLKRRFIMKKNKGKHAS